MNDDNRFGASPKPADPVAAPEPATPEPATPEPANPEPTTPEPTTPEPAAQAPAADEAAPAPPATASTAVLKFKSCRWRCDPEDGEFCTHRDVLPYAGKVGFSPDSWCPECAYYKLRRTPKKRERVDYTY